jgi:hypothetical protein
MKTSFNFRLSFLITIFLCAFLFSYAINAQTPKQNKGYFKNLTPEQRAKMLTDSMKVKLPLENNQYKSIYDINLKYAVKVEPILKGTDNRITKFQKINAMQPDKEAEYKKLLTDTQFKKYMKLKDQLMKKAMNKMN